MAFQADGAHLPASQHARIRGTMRLMATGASFKAHGCMFKGEGSALIAVALEATRLIRPEALRQCRPSAAVRIMAIDTAHGALGKPMVKGLLKLRPDIRVAGGALLIDGVRLAGHDARRSIGMHLMARHAGDQIFHMATGNACGVHRVARVTRETRFIRQSSCEFGRILDIRGGGRPGMVAACAMTRFAGPAFPFRPFADLNGLMRTLHETAVDILVAGLACL